MLYTIEKGNISFSADTFGAELHSIKLGGREYLWQCGDAWKRYAPVLFPFVCSPKDRAYRADGKDYRMKANHGFARDMEFSLVKAEANIVEFVLRDSAYNRSCGKSACGEREYSCGDKGAVRQ